ncbi:MAG: UPF0149 family protein [Methylococcaceae bacterium]
MINKTLLENLATSLGHITSEDEHLNLNELRGLFHAMMITPISSNPANWIAGFFYGEHPELTDAQIEELNNSTRPVYEAYQEIFKANKLRFPFDLTKLDEATAEAAYDWSRGFFVGLLVTEELWFGQEGEPAIVDNPELATVRAAARVFVGLINKDFSVFEAEKIEELHSILREQGQEPSEDLMAATLFPSVPAAVKTLQQFGIRLMQAAAQEAKKPAIQPPRKMGRNEPCFCGSGKKYKKCCGA